MSFLRISLVSRIPRVSLKLEGWAHLLASIVMFGKPGLIIRELITCHLICKERIEISASEQESWDLICAQQIILI